MNFDVPDEVTTVYLFNPLFKDAIIRFLDNIRISLKRNPRIINLIYYNPKFPEVIEQTGGRIVKDIVFNHFSIYRSQGIIFQFDPSE